MTFWNISFYFDRKSQQMTFWNIFFLFSQKICLRFHTNCLQWDNLHKMSNPNFWEKYGKYHPSVLCYIVQKVVMVSLTLSPLSFWALYMYIPSLKFPPLKHQSQLQLMTLSNIFFHLFFLESKSWHFMWIICQADDSHEISRLSF